jgi:amino acid transporter
VNSAADHNAGTLKIELKRELTRLESYATIIGIGVGSGIFVVTGKSGAIAGPSVPLAYLVLAPVVLVTAVGYSVYLSTPLGTRPGGEYLHISRTTGAILALWRCGGGSLHRGARYSVRLACHTSSSSTRAWIGGCPA